MFDLRWIFASAVTVPMLASSFGLALAEPLAQPKEAVVVTVSGNISNTNTPDGAARFDLPMLESLASHEGTMETPWTTGRVTFKGPLGRALLKAVGAKGEVLKIVALDDYAVDVPVADLIDHDVMLATRMNGKPMSVREKGPLFVIYPFDTEPNLYNEKYFSRSAWQIKSIEVR